MPGMPSYLPAFNIVSPRRLPSSIPGADTSHMQTSVQRSRSSYSSFHDDSLRYPVTTIFGGFTATRAHGAPQRMPSPTGGHPGAYACRRSHLLVRWDLVPFAT